MTKIMLEKMQRIFLFLCVLSLPITGLPQKFSIPGIGNNPFICFFLLGFFFHLLEVVRFKKNTNKLIYQFIGIFIGWQILCLVIGLINYEYVDLLQVEKMERLGKVVLTLERYGIEISLLTAAKVWMFFRFSKDIFLGYTLTFLLAYWIFSLYEGNLKKAFTDIRKSLLILAICMGIYSVIELSWLKLHSLTAKSMLMIINPLLYDPVSAHGWWPPLLWNNQLRSMTREPSFFGILSTLIIPFLWSYLLEYEREITTKKYIVLLSFVCYFSVMIFATNARTAIILLLINIVFLVGSLIVVRNKSYLKSTGIILLFTVIAFGINLINFNSLLTVRETSKADSYFSEVNHFYDSNIDSITKNNARSNGARLINLQANLNVVKEFPLFGVGTGLKDAYIDAFLPQGALTNSEVRRWNNDLHEKGPLLGGYPSLNIYADLVVKSGIIGVVLYILPFGYVIARLWKNRRSHKIISYELMILFSMITFMIAGFSNIMFSQCSGIGLGLLYCKIYSLEEYKTKSDDEY